MAILEILKACVFLGAKWDAVNHIYMYYKTVVIASQLLMHACFYPHANYFLNKTTE